MTIEEKLQHFYEATVEESRKEAETSVQKHREKLAQELEEHRSLQQKSAEAAVKAESDNVIREVNKALSLEELTLKRSWTAHQKDLREQLFIEVKNLLGDFMASRDYEDYLCRRIREAKRFAEQDEVFIYLTGEDSARIPALTERTGIPLQVAEKPFLGGVQAIIPSKNIRIDNSFLSALETLKKEFKFDGGLKKS